MAEKDFMTIGSTGLQQWGGYIDEEFLSTLKGRRAAAFYREMAENNPIIGAILYIIENLIRQVEWRIEAASADVAAEREAAFVEQCLGDMQLSFEDVISEALSMITHGYCPQEIVYKLRKGDTEDPSTRSAYNDGRVGWRTIEVRAQDTVEKWMFDEEQNVAGFYQNDTAANKGMVFIPIDKLLLFRTKVSKGNPEGKSLLRPSVTSYYRLKRIQSAEAIGVERNLTGMPIFEVPRDLLINNPSTENAALRSMLERWIQQVRVDERYGGLVPTELDHDGKPTGFKFKLLSTGGSSGIDTDKIIRRYESRIAMTFLAEFILLGMDKVGSFALVSSKTNLFAVALNTIMNNITTVFNKYAIRRLQALNGQPVELDPKLVHGDIENIELSELAPFIQALANSGILSPNPGLEKRLLEMVKLPLPPEVEP